MQLVPNDGAKKLGDSKYQFLKRVEEETRETIGQSV